MTRFKVGDKVRVRKDIKEIGCKYGINKEMVGQEGVVHTVTAICHDSISLDQIGWRWTENLLEPVCDEWIQIRADGDITMASLYKNGRRVKRRYAKCSPEDRFDLKVGAQLALTRLLGTKAERAATYRDEPAISIPNTFEFTLHGADISDEALEAMFVVDGVESSKPVSDAADTCSIKSEFDIEAFKAEEFVVNCLTENDAKLFLGYLQSKGVVWCNGKRPLDVDVESWFFEDNTCYRMESVWGPSPRLTIERSITSRAFNTKILVFDAEKFGIVKVKESVAVMEDKPESKSADTVKYDVKYDSVFVEEFDFEGFKAGKFVVNCKTEEECREFLDYCEGKGLGWFLGYRPGPCIYAYGKNTCYSFNFDGRSCLGYSSRGFYIEENIPVIEFASIAFDSEDDTSTTSFSRFNLEDFKAGKFTVNCRTQDDTLVFMEYLEKHGVVWVGGAKPTEISPEHRCWFGSDTCYRMELRGGDGVVLTFEDVAAGVLSETDILVFNADELRADKPTTKFNYDDFVAGKFSVNCRTEDDARVFLKYLGSKGLRWRTGELSSDMMFWCYDENTTYSTSGAADGRALMYANTVWDEKHEGLEVIPFNADDLKLDAPVEKFDLDEFKNYKFAVRCKSKEEATVLLGYLKGKGFTWRSKDDLLCGAVTLQVYGDETCYAHDLSPSGVCYGSVEYYNQLIPIVEFTSCAFDDADEPEVVKRVEIAFDYDKFVNGELAVECCGREESQRFISYMHAKGLRWRSGDPALDFVPHHIEGRLCYAYKLGHSRGITFDTPEWFKQKGMPVVRFCPDDLA